MNSLNEIYTSVFHFILFVLSHDLNLNSPKNKKKKKNMEILFLSLAFSTSATLFFLLEYSSR